MELGRKTQRGLTETPEEKSKMLSLFTQLEALNSEKKTVASNKLNGTWVLEYTTSDRILGKNGRSGLFQGGRNKVGKILQIIGIPPPHLSCTVTNFASDIFQLKAENREVINYFGFNINRGITADLLPVSDSEVTVQFRRFSIGPISFNTPSSFRGRLDVTYLDDELRLSRGDRGNLFVLTKVKSG